MATFWNQFPPVNKLVHRISKQDIDKIFNVNAHLHTPFSFSAFDSVDQAVKLAVEQNVRIIGINDFYTTSGFESWAETCSRYKAFPLFNIEFIVLSKADQKNNIRINDPNNPGRIYVSGKGLSFPFQLEESYKSKFDNLILESNKHVKLMCNKLNQHLSDCGVAIHLEYDSILKSHTKGMIRERHLARVLREKVFDSTSNEEECKILLSEIYGNKQVKTVVTNHAALENEIRNNLLKSGGQAFVPEKPDLFLSIGEAIDLILKGGGIPTYPLLADDNMGAFTEFEMDKEVLAEKLKEFGIFSIEFISVRNSTEILQEYATWFSENGFVVTFGSEHNTPELTPVLLYTRDGTPLPENLREINYQGACLIAAHQYLKATQNKGYLNEGGVPFHRKKEEFILLGNALINFFLMN